VLVSASLKARAQETAVSYPKMASIDQYLMADRNAEIAMARSSAPPSISADAAVVVLGTHGYETAVKGKNGFVCLVERSWMSPFDFPEFCNPKMRGPICFNPAAVRSILPLTFKRTELALAGLSKAQIMDSIKAFDAKELPPVEPGAMSYMMSTQGYLNDSARHWVPHLMFYVPLTDPKSWGADLPGTPVMLNSQFQGAPEPITEHLTLRLVFDADDLGQLRRRKEGVVVGKAHPFGIEIAFRKVGPADFVIIRFDGRVLQ
jgi:hypothetical protein